MGQFLRPEKSTLKKMGRPPLYLLLWGCSAAAWAGEQIGSQALRPSDYLGQLALSLGFVLVMIFIAAWLLRRFSQLPGMKGQHIQILSAMAVGRQEKLLLVQVGKEQMLIGVTPSKITLLQTLAEPIAVADNEHHASSNHPFSKWLQDALKQAPKQ